MHHYALIGFLGGLLAFPHCLGMCGGFMTHLAIGKGCRNNTPLAAQLAWLTGKTFTYSFAGAVAGFFGAKADLFFQHSYLQNTTSYLSGGLILLAGVTLLGFAPTINSNGAGSGGILVRMLRPVLTTPSRRRGMVLGMITAFLPCPVIISMLAYSLQSGSVITGMTTMAALGIGTSLPLLAMGEAGRLLTSRGKRYGAAASGTLLVLLGLITMLRGSATVHNRAGCPAPISAPPSTAVSDRGWCPKTNNGSHGN